MASPGKVTKYDEHEVIQLNVGGCLYTTKRSTLTTASSKDGSMLGGKVNPSVLDDSSGTYILDRDGRIFRHVLNFLRQGKLILPEDFKEWELLASETDYYGVKPLAEAVKEAKCRRVGSEEFIELSVVPKLSYTYIGNSSTLKKIPRLNDFFSRFPGPMPAFSPDVQVTYTVKTPSGTVKLLRSFEEEKEAIFKEIEELGFQAKKQSHTNDAEAWDRIVEMGWTFSRRISG